MAAWVIVSLFDTWQSRQTNSFHTLALCIITAWVIGTLSYLSSMHRLGDFVSFRNMTYSTEKFLPYLKVMHNYSLGDCVSFRYMTDSFLTWGLCMMTAWVIVSLVDTCQARQTNSFFTWAICMMTAWVIVSLFDTWHTRQTNSFFTWVIHDDRLGDPISFRYMSHSSEKFLPYLSDMHDDRLGDPISFRYLSHLAGIFPLGYHYFLR